MHGIELRVDRRRAQLLFTVLTFIYTFFKYAHVFSTPTYIDLAMLAGPHYRRRRHRHPRPTGNMAGDAGTKELWAAGTARLCARGADMLI